MVPLSSLCLQKLYYEQKRSLSVRVLVPHMFSRAQGVQHNTKLICCLDSAVHILTEEAMSLMSTQKRASTVMVHKNSMNTLE